MLATSHHHDRRVDLDGCIPLCHGAAFTASLRIPTSLPGGFSCRRWETAVPHTQWQRLAWGERKPGQRRYWIIGIEPCRDAGRQCRESRPNEKHVCNSSQREANPIKTEEEDCSKDHRDPGAHSWAYRQVEATGSRWPAGCSNRGIPWRVDGPISWGARGRAQSCLSGSSYQRASACYMATAGSSGDIRRRNQARQQIWSIPAIQQRWSLLDGQKQVRGYAACAGRETGLASRLGAMRRFHSGHYGHMGIAEGTGLDPWRFSIGARVYPWEIACLATIISFSW